MTERARITCPACGAEMNRHAEKVDSSGTDGFDSELGGVLMEFHTCPACGLVVERRAE